jgi:hypothetical protein
LPTADAIVMVARVRGDGIESPPGKPAALRDERRAPASQRFAATQSDRFDERQSLVAHSKTASHAVAPSIYLLNCAFLR